MRWYHGELIDIYDKGLFFRPKFNKVSITDLNKRKKHIKKRRVKKTCYLITIFGIWYSHPF